MSKELTGKVALVTGGSRGIGAAIAKALADDGADVAISYAASADKANAVVKELRAKGVRSEAFQADQANAKEVEALVKTVAERFGRLDILVNNAGAFATGQVHDRANNLAELDRLFAINVGGVAAAVCTAAPLLRDGGRIISIGSVVGERSPFPGIGDYSATKAATIGYTRGWARDFGPRGSPSTTCSRARSTPT
jgi:3-oxoacyl-[acyl-carrier protein] reductase